MTKMQPYLKQFAALATAWREKYGSDLFFRTTVRIVALQVGLVVLCIAIFAVALLYPAEELPAFATVVCLALIFGVVLARVTLRPARDNLTYQKLFISNVAHELRTPLSTIKTSSEVALLDDELRAPVRRTFHEIVGELDRISEIINNLLSLNTLTRPERMQFERVDLSPLIDQIMKRLSPLSRERNINVTVKIGTFTAVWGNARGLEQVMANVVKNALAYTPKDGRGKVSVTVGPDYHGSVVFCVADNGIGIASEDLEHIFEPFYRADTSRVRNVSHTGSGLGLTIVSEIVRLHHGNIRIESERRKGTTVFVFLPAAQEPPEKASPVLQRGWRML